MRKLNRPSICVLGLAFACCVATAQALKPCDLMKMMMNADQQIARQGIDGFVKLGQMGAVPLLCFLSGQAPGAPAATGQGKSNAEKALVKIGSAAVPAIVERLGTSDEEFRTRLVRVLGQIRDPRITQPLMNLWKSEKSDRVRRMLVDSLARILKPGELLPLLRERIPLPGPRNSGRSPGNLRSRRGRSTWAGCSLGYPPTSSSSSGWMSSRTSRPWAAMPPPPQPRDSKR